MLCTLEITSCVHGKLPGDLSQTLPIYDLIICCWKLAAIESYLVVLFFIHILMLAQKINIFNQNNISWMDDPVKNIKYRCISYISKVFYNYYVWRYIQNNSILYIKPFLCVEKLILYQIHKTLTSCHRKKLYYFQSVQYYWSHILLPSNE